MPHTRIAALALATATLAASGCGGSTKTASSGTQPSGTSQPSGGAEPAAQTKPLARAELIAQADAICHRVIVKLEASKLKSVQDYARVFPPLAVYERAAFIELGKLVPPASMASTWEQIVAYTTQLANSTAQAGEDAVTNKLKAAVPAEAMFEHAQKNLAVVASHAGFKDCSQIG